MTANMRKGLFFFIALSLIHLYLVAGSRAEPTLTMVYMADAAPANWLENGVAKGIEPEINQYICDRLGIKLVHEFYPWIRAQERVESGEADAYLSTPTSKRFEYAVFGKENVFPNYWNIFIRKGDTRLAQKVKSFTRLEDLKPYNLIDFLGNGWSAAFMRAADGYKIHHVTRIDQLPLMLTAGRAEILINSSSWINWWAAKQGVSDLIEEHEVDWPWTRFHFVFILSRKSPWVKKGLVRAYDREVKKMKEAGIWQAILKKYKNPHGLGKPFTSMLDAEYEAKGGFYKKYTQYPLYEPGH